jgi:predicted metal-dependent hydrolase
LHLIDWYKNKAQAYIKDIAYEYSNRLGINLSGIKVLDLDNRWGSCSAKGVVNFNWKILQLPHSMIRYVVAHEVAHLLEKHHTPEFWSVLERLLPDYEQQLISLRINGVKYMRL